MSNRAKGIGRGGFGVVLGAERRVEWRAPGGIKCVAVRGDGSTWELVEGPAERVAKWTREHKRFRHLRDLRSALRGDNP